MSPMEHSRELKKAFGSARLTGAAFVACLFFYLVLIELVKSRYRPFAGFARLTDVQTLRIVLFAAAVALVVLNRVLNGRLLKKGAGPDPATTVRTLYRAAIISLTLAEMPAIIGLVLFFLSGLYKDFYVMLFVSLVLIFMYFPRLKNWEAYLADQPVACRL